MRRTKTAYEFRQCQIYTPKTTVELFWKLLRIKRPDLGSVVDLGAGDGRFSQYGHYNRYLGLEIDKESNRIKLPTNAAIEICCAFEHDGRGWDAAIGNPPYVRHHYIELEWSELIAERFRNTLDVRLNRQANLFIYFFFLGLEITKDDGIVAMITPYEWVSRPSAKPLRDLIEKSGWSVDVYRFREDVFQDVMTTASVSIIDKSTKKTKWSLFEIDKDYAVSRKGNVAGSRFKVLPHEKRGPWWTLRGLSPGTQRSFTLTEGERICNGLSLDDVVPCVTTLKHLPTDCKELDKRAFNRYFRDNGVKCWLIKSYESSISHSLQAYLKAVPYENRDTATCNLRAIWYQFTPFPVAQVLVASGFTSKGPKVAINVVGAHHVGSVYGLFGASQQSAKTVAYISNYDFEKRVVAHSGKLKKIEVRQMNAVLNRMPHAYQFSQ